MFKKKTAIVTCNAGCKHKVSADPGNLYSTTIDGEVYILQRHPVEDDEYLVELIPYRSNRHVGHVTETNW